MHDPLKGVREIVVTFAPGEVGKKTTCSSVDIAAMIFWKRMNHEIQECFDVLALNHKYEVMSVRRVARGTTDHLIADPREILWSAVHQRASVIVVAHNHPDHDSEPSDADLTFTENLEAAGKVLGIEVQDHIIIGTDSWTSIMQYRVNKTKNVATKAAKPPPKSKVSWTRGVA